MAQIITPLGPVEAIPYPGRIVKTGDSDKTIVKAIQQRLNAVGCGPIDETGMFDKDQTEKAVKLFQARFTDVTGRPLEVDGKVGSLTWGALFGESSVISASTAPSALTKAVIDFATTQIGVMENPPGSNRGREVDLYLRSVGLDPAQDSFPWCVAFTFFCYQQASSNLAIANPHVKTAGVLSHWNKVKNKSGVLRVTSDQAKNNPGLVKPGSLFIIDTGGGNGHSGIVVEVANGRLLTIEGNTNDGGSRNGIGVFKRDARKISKINKGFIDYSGF